MKIDIREINATDAGECIQLLNMAEGLASRFCVMTDRIGETGEEMEDGEENPPGDTVKLPLKEYNRLMQSDAKRAHFERENHDLQITNQNLVGQLTIREKRIGELETMTAAVLGDQKNLLARIRLLEEDKPRETVVKSPQESPPEPPQPPEPDPPVSIPTEKKIETGFHPGAHPDAIPEPPASPTEEAKARLGEPAEDPEGVEKKVKDIRKPKGKPRPERAKVSEAPGECLHCDLVSCTMKGWYCKDSMRALPVDAKKCKKFVEGVPDGEEEPSPPPPAPSDPLEEEIKKSREANDPPESPQETPQPPEPEVNTSAPVSPEPGTQAPPDPGKDPQTPPAPTPPPASAEDTDPEAFIRKQGELPKDPEELRNMIRNEARLCIQNPAFKEPFKVVMKKYGAAITQIPEDKLQACVSELQAIRGAGGDPQGEFEF